MEVVLYTIASKFDWFRARLLRKTLAHETFQEIFCRRDIRLLSLFSLAFAFSLITAFLFRLLCLPFFLIRFQAFSLACFCFFIILWLFFIGYDQLKTETKPAWRGSDCSCLLQQLTSYF